jgi:hypothetical protein
MRKYPNACREGSGKKISNFTGYTHRRHIPVVHRYSEVYLEFSQNDPDRISRVWRGLHTEVMEKLPNYVCTMVCWWVQQRTTTLGIENTHTPTPSHACTHAHTYTQVNRYMPPHRRCCGGIKIKLFL